MEPSTRLNADCANTAKRRNPDQPGLASIVQRGGERLGGANVRADKDRNRRVRDNRPVDRFQDGAPPVRLLQRGKLQSRRKEQRCRSSASNRSPPTE